MPLAARSRRLSPSTICCGPPFLGLLDAQTGHGFLLLPDETRKRSISPPPIRRKTGWTTPTWRRRAGAGNTTILPAAAPTRCPAANGCSCRCGPAAATVGVLGIERDAPGPLLTDGRTSPPGCAGGSGRGRHRTHFAGTRSGGSARTGRDRADACRAADIDLARFANPARLDPRNGVEPAQLRRQNTARATATNCWRRWKARRNV